MKVRYYGHVGQQTGYGKAAMDLCMALVRAGVDLQIRPLAPPAAISIPDAYLPLARLLHREDSLDPSPDVIVVHTLPLDCPRVLEAIDRVEPRAAGQRRVAYTTWETSGAPLEMTEALIANFDQLWTPSEICGLSFYYPGQDYEKIRTLPHCFDEETLPRRRKRIPSDGPFRFYYVGAWTGRKNPAGLVRAYVHAFSARDEVELVIQSAGLKPEALAVVLGGTGVSQQEMPKISIGAHYRSDDDILDLHAAADCFVTASHGEAWNLPAFDAMLAGRHVIAPLGRDRTSSSTGPRRPGTHRAAGSRRSTSSCAVQPGAAWPDGHAGDRRAGAELQARMGRAEPHRARGPHARGRERTKARSQDRLRPHPTVRLPRSRRARLQTPRGDQAMKETETQYEPPPIAGIIKMLLDEAPKLQNRDGSPDATQAAAVMCHVVLRGQMQPLFGSLSLHPLGVLRMLTPSKVQHPGEQTPRDILLEQFFDVDDVQSVMVEREVKATPGSRIITS